ncbi:hypothetical protein C5F47_05985 [Nitrosopumilus cobalaminigenes]|uniref:Uncharacterized protein n=1 Tax=Nitrosopumilus cobalaminigenes TaxID=1470066 RepID=A0A7D5M3X6_9ARCH|nr:hypothetical protein [Nitrosopumilus cobalaminigenes]QLH03129.1 hypothetical protein C5F47_05985 [Nitrosopumilus cobalaminigenes]
MKPVIIIAIIFGLFTLPTLVDDVNGQRWEFFGEIREKGLSDDQITSMLIFVISGIIVNVFLFRKDIRKKFNR